MSPVAAAPGAYERVRAAYAQVAARSPLREGPALSALADDDELRYREEVEFERIADPVRDVIDWIERKELPGLLRYTLERTGVRPRGAVVDLGAGTCWQAAELARRPEVDRVVAIEFSRRRIEVLAPAAIAYLGGPPEKIERLHADFYNHGLGAEVADFVFTDASYHHAADPVRLARVALDLLRPGGTLVLHREPTLSLLRRTRDHHEEGKHGDFEHEYFAKEYLAQLREAGFERTEKHPASIGFSAWRRAWMRPPLSWLNGIVHGSYSYVAIKGPEAPVAGPAPQRARSA